MNEQLEALIYAVKVIRLMEELHNKTIEAIMECYPKVKKPPILELPPMGIIEKAIIRALYFKEKP